MSDILRTLIITDSFIPHGHCYLWKPGLVWLHLTSDALIALAYYSIPLTLFYFVRKRQDLPFHGIFLWFAAFIIACGTTHLVAIWTLWHPTYWLSGSIKALTAAISLCTAVQLLPLVPQALALPSPAQLEQANWALQQQIQERLRVEQALRQSQNQLEQRVQERTAELSAANQQLQQEIRDRQHTEDALRASKAEIAALNRDLQHRVNELQTLFDVIPIGILISDDLEFKRVRANPAFAQILGVPTGDNASWTPTNQPPPSYKVLRNGQELTPEETPLRYAAIHGVTVERAEVDILRGDGALFNLFGYASPLLDEQGAARGAVGAFLDITDRKRAEAEREQLLERERVARAQAEAANRVKDEFLAVLSHELRTPLNPIIGWIQLLRTGTLDTRRTALALETIERNAKLQTQLIDDLLDISRILQGKLTLTVTPVDLAATIAAAQETIRLAAEAKAIQIHSDLEPIGQPLMGDANRLQQVVWNLLANAVKFTPTGGQIEIRLEQVEDLETGGMPIPCVQIQVKDNGRGIRRDFLPHVFDYFRQADSSTTRQFGGLGLGLAIVRQIVELHGGTVTAESAGEGLGSTFRVRLPLTAVSWKPHPVDQLPSSDSLHHLHILVVDDEADTRELLLFILTQHGAKVRLAASATDALALFQQTRPDLLLSDIAMPGTDGYGLIKQIRALESTQATSTSTPAIALTAYVGAEDQRQALTAGFQRHLPKPIDPEELIRAIVQLMQADQRRPSGDR